MTMMIHTTIPASARLSFRIRFGFLAKMAQYIIAAHRHSREAQNLRHAHDAILKDVGLSRLKASGHTYVIAHK